MKDFKIKQIQNSFSVLKELSVSLFFVFYFLYRQFTVYSADWVNKRQK